MKAVQIERELTECRHLFEGYFSAVDDAERPDDLIPAAMQMMQYGEWLVNREQNEAVGLTFVNYGRPGIFCLVSAVAHAAIESVVDYIFSPQFPYQYHKIKSVVPEGSAFDAVVRDNFPAMAISLSDTLLGGTLLNTITYERYHPQWLQTAGEDLDDGRSEGMGRADVRPDEPDQHGQRPDAAVVANIADLGERRASASDPELHDRLRESSGASPVLKRQRSRKRK